MYSAAVTRDTAQRRVDRLNNPGFYSNDEKCYTVGMERAAKKKEREQAKKEKEEAKKKKREAKEK